MILKPNYIYSFVRVDTKRRDKEREDKVKFPYYGEILSDSWGDGKEPKDKLLWDEDINSADFWAYEDIYPELINFINLSVTEGFLIHIAESYKDSINPKEAPNDYAIKEPISKLDDAQWSHLVEEDKKLIMSSPYGQFFAHLPNRPLIDEEKLKQLKGKPYFGDKTWQIGDSHLYCLLVMGEDIQMVTLSHRHIKELEEHYEYVQMNAQVPLFKKKELKDA